MEGMDRKLTRTRRSLTALATLGLAAALTMACADDNGNGTTGGTDATGDNGTSAGPAAGEASLSIVGPLDGDAVTVPFDVVVNTDVELGPIADGVHHLHIWFGDDPTDQTGFDLYESDEVQVMRAPDGEQTMWVQVHTFDHQPASDPISVSLLIEGGGGGSDQTSRGNPYDY
jgi:hypothetical protein